jgi:hypothetical protein
MEALAYNLLTERLKVAAAAVALPVAFADVTFPADGVSEKPDEYLEVAFFVNDPSNRAISSGNERFLGIYQVTLVAVERRGLEPRLEIARQVADFYVKGETLHGSNGKVKITKKPYLAGTLRDGGELRIPVTVEYEFFA